MDFKTDMINMINGLQPTSDGLPTSQSSQSYDQYDTLVRKIVCWERTMSRAMQLLGVLTSGIRSGDIT